jgi:hypothetical protein
MANLALLLLVSLPFALGLTKALGFLFPWIRGEGRSVV